MEYSVKFITAAPYDFVAANGQRITGVTAHCFDQNSKKIIKVKVRDVNAVNGLSFGDDLTIYCVPNGRYMNYEV